jgi:DNA-binding beta-propeller fold protein YncE
MIKKIILIICSLIFMVACAKPYKEKVPEMYWPMPPNKPRVKFLNLIIGSIDVTKDRENKFKTLLFGEPGEVKFFKPTFIAARDNIVYVTDITGIHVYNFKRATYSLFGAGLTASPTGIDVDSKGNIYVADSGKRKIFIIDKKGRLVKSISDPKKLNNMGGVHVDEPRNRFFVANTRKHNIEVFSLDGEPLFTLGRSGSGDGEFNYPYDVTVDSTGDIFVLDSGNFRVQVFDDKGNYKYKFGSVGTAPGHFARPKSLAISSDDKLFVIDAAFGNFQIFNKRGGVYLSVGQSGYQVAEFMLPMGIAINEKDHIYVVDQLNRRLQVFEYIKYKVKR